MSTSESLQNTTDSGLPAIEAGRTRLRFVLARAHLEQSVRSGGDI